MAPRCTVRQGEDLPRIAQDSGLADWPASFDQAENAGFREKRPDPTVRSPGQRAGRIQGRPAGVGTR